jgi:hypothetical protein
MRCVSAPDPSFDGRRAAVAPGWASLRYGPHPSGPWRALKGPRAFANAGGPAKKLAPFRGSDSFCLSVGCADRYPPSSTKDAVRSNRFARPTPGRRPETWWRAQRAISLTTIRSVVPVCPPRLTAPVQGGRCAATGPHRLVWTSDGQRSAQPTFREKLSEVGRRPAEFFSRPVGRPHEAGTPRAAGSWGAALGASIGPPSPAPRANRRAPSTTTTDRPLTPRSSAPGSP